MTMDDLAGKAAVVTGGGSGIGRALALAFAAEGMKVVIADRESDRATEVAAEVVAAGGTALAQSCDVADQSAVETMRDATLTAFGRVDILCNNAGVVQSGPLAEAPQEDWDWVFAVNVGGVVNGIRAFVPQMKAQGGGHILNTASLSGLYAMPAFGIYTASKYAVVAISETLRIELAPNGIGVSVLCPGWVRSRIDETTRVRDGVAELPPPSGAPPLEFCEAEDAAGIALAGIRANQQYIYTHAGGAVRARMRFDAILGDFEGM
jgi:NAD(P)-dependent dehydrogenase (short-subunit alcohol dehydrogenase family)